jgi:hypothetical protein
MVPSPNRRTKTLRIVFAPVDYLPIIGIKLGGYARHAPSKGKKVMKAQTVDVKVSGGRILCCTVFRPGGKKLLAKGHVISEDDIRFGTREK